MSILIWTPYRLSILSIIEDILTPDIVIKSKRQEIYSSTLTWRTSTLPVSFEQTACWPGFNVTSFFPSARNNCTEPDCSVVLLIFPSGEVVMQKEVPTTFTIIALVFTTKGCKVSLTTSKKASPCNSTKR